MNPLKRAERWLRTGIRRQLGRALYTRPGRKFLARYLPSFVTQLCIDCGDHRLTVSPHELIGRRVIRDGQFSRALVDQVITRVAADGGFDGGRDVALDIGANIGTQTVYFCLSRRFARVLAVEPAPCNLELLELNVRQNGFDDRVTIVAAAAGDADGEMMLHLDPDNHGGNSLVNTRSARGATPVPVRRIDDMIAAADIDPERIALIWMDIEGYEPVACRSMEPLLKRQTPLVTEFQSEFLGPQGSADFIAYLGSFYRRCVVFPERGAPFEARVADIRIQRGILDVLLLPG
ncbi:MAG: FkbM family methyltransferase [Lautropia sp.]